METYVLLPAYNEESGLRQLLPRLASVCAQTCAGGDFRIVVVNDGSADGTAAVAEEAARTLPVHLLDFPTNRGVTEVFRTGFRWVCEHAGPEAVCLTMDADGTQSPDRIPALLDALRRSEVVIASRFQPGGGMTGAPLIRRFWSAAASLTMRTLLRLPGVTDYSTFYRGYRVSALRAGFQRFGDDLVSGHGFASVAGILPRLHAVGCSFAEVPFVLRYDAKVGASGMPLLKTLRGYAALLTAGRRALKKAAREESVL